MHCSECLRDASTSAALRPLQEEQDRIRSQRKLENKKASKQDKMMRSGRLTANFLEGDEGEDVRGPPRRRV